MEQPDRNAHRVLPEAALSRSTAQNKIPRPRRAGAGVSDQRFFTACPDDSRTLQGSVADRTILQMDKATPAHQGLLRHECQRRQDADLDRRLCLSAHRHYEEAAENRTVALHNSTDIERVRFRENAAFTGVSGRGMQEQRGRLFQPVAAVRLILGH